MPNDNYRDRVPGDSTGWFVAIIVALALLAIGYLVFIGSTSGTWSIHPTTEQTQP